MKATRARILRIAAPLALAVVLAGAASACGSALTPSVSPATLPPSPPACGPGASAGTSASSAAASSGLLAACADDGARIVRTSSVGERLIDLHIESPAMGGEVSARLLLPKRFDAEPARTWPALYMLHGANTPDALSSFTRHPEFLRMLEDAGVLVVTPYAGDYGYYSDWSNGGAGGPPRWETFHLVELRQLLERNYRASDRRAIGGISMGGFGAISYAGRHPGMFVAAASFSGVLDTGQATWRFDPAIWGEGDGQTDARRAHNPVDVAERLRGTSLYIAYGNGKPGPLDPPGTAADSLEASIGRMNEAFVDRLRDLGIDATVDAYGPGTHAWAYWSRELGVWLPEALAALRT